VTARILLSSSLGLAVVLGGVLGLETRMDAPRAPTPPVAAVESRAWPMLPLERQASRSIEERVTLIRQEIARVSSGNRGLERSIYAAVAAAQAVDRDDEELRHEAERRCGLAVVQSGSAWVGRR
jgi:hypothetical protein